MIRAEIKLSGWIVLFGLFNARGRIRQSLKT